VSYVKLLRVAAKVGRVTRKYPAEGSLVTEYFRGTIEIDPAMCWGCGACALACPPNSLTTKVEGDRIVIEYFIGRCIFCGRCADVCPKEAITITKNFEHASKSLEDLKYRVIHRVSRCSRCGGPVGAEEEVRNVSERAYPVKASLDLCPSCRAELLAEALAKYHPRRSR